MDEKRTERGVELLFGYLIGDLVETRTDSGEWVPGVLVGKYRRDLCSRPLDPANTSTAWTYSNPTRVRRLTPERMEQWLEER